MYITPTTWLWSVVLGTGRAETKLLPELTVRSELLIIAMDVEVNTFILMGILQALFQLVYCPPAEY